MNSSCFPWKVVIFFGKKHVIWSNVSGVMIGLSWKTKFGKFHYLFCSFFSNLIFQLLPIITPPKRDQLTCSLPKNVTTFHGEQDGIIHFCLSPNKKGVLALTIYIFTKKIINFSKLNFSTSIRLPKKPFYWDYFWK